MNLDNIDQNYDLNYNTSSFYSKMFSIINDFVPIFTTFNQSIVFLYGLAIYWYV